MPQLRVVTAVSFDPNFAAATEDCIRARFVQSERHRLRLAKFGNHILTEFLRTFLCNKRLYVNPPCAVIGGSRLSGERGPEQRAAECETRDHPNVHARDYPPTQ